MEEKYKDSCANRHKTYSCVQQKQARKSIQKVHAPAI